MTAIAPVHWYEGLFLQPHHLQTMQRQLLNRIERGNAMRWAYPYGVIDARLSSDALVNMLVRFDRLHAVMPDGLEICFPETADLAPLDIKNAFEASSNGLTVYLAVPHWTAGRPNTIDQGADVSSFVKRRFRTVELDEVNDENTGDQPQPVQVRHVNARLVLDADDATDMDTIPLLRVVPGVGQDVGLPRQDPNFVGPCLVLGGSSALRDMVRDLVHQIQASRDSLVVELTRGGFNIDALSGRTIEQLMRLQVLNRFAGRLPQLIEVPNLSPFELYLEYRELLGELAALHPDNDIFDAPAYQHDAPCPAFADLSNRIRSLLRGAVAPGYLQVEFQRQDDILVAELTENHLIQPNQYLLGIRTRQDPRALAQLVQDADVFKVMARSLSRSRVRGIRLQEERHPPLGLPASNNLYYFRLLRSENDRMWQRIVDEKAIAIRWPDVVTADYQVTLFMTIPSGESTK